MSKPLFDWLEEEALFFDNNLIRNQAGSVVARIRGDVVYPAHGTHMGWFYDGVLYDSELRALAYLREHGGCLPGAEQTANSFTATMVAGGRRAKQRPHPVPAGRWSLHDARTYFSS